MRLGLKGHHSFSENWGKNWNFEKKMHIIIVNTFVMIIVLTVLFSTLSSIHAIMQQSKLTAVEELGTIAADYENSLEQYRSMMIATVMDTHVQKYCKSNTTIERNFHHQDVYNSISNIINAQYNANFMVVMDRSGRNQVYCGNVGISQSRFSTEFERDYEESVFAKEHSTIRISYANNYLTKNQYSLTLYFPIYSTTNVNQDMGLLVLNVQDDMLGKNIRTEFVGYSDLFILDLNGVVVSNQNRSKIGEKLVDAKKLSGDSGGFISHGTYITYQKMGRWNYYLVNQIPLFRLVRYSLSAALFMLITMVLLMLVALGIIRVVMKEVKEEQRQMNQIQLNALHSQIQPHFLYNTLECIHWQAAAEGNQEISTLVKALASYYRLCLNDGKDIIPLSKELEHIRNYIIIQNMRYDNIIELDIQIPEKYYSVMLPKLTLQPLVENSIYHGIRVKEGRKGVVSITIEETDEVCICVSDDGQGMPQEVIDHINQHISEFDENIGYGINNVNKRIELLCGPQYGLFYSKKEPTGLTVKINLPGNDEKGGRKNV